MQVLVAVGEPALVRRWRVEEHGEPGQPVVLGVLLAGAGADRGGGDQQPDPDQAEDREGGEDPLADAGRPEQPDHHGEQAEHGAQVVVADQQEEQADHREERGGQLPPPAERGALAGDHVRAPEHQAELRQLGGLHLDRADVQPEQPGLQRAEDGVPGPVELVPQVQDVQHHQQYHRDAEGRQPDRPEGTGRQALADPEGDQPDQGEERLLG
ncbi:hypothetical protein GCM10027615_72710 [Plantactinospora veratri]